MHGKVQSIKISRSTINSQPATPNYLVVGAGLAGCLIAWRLRAAGCRVRMVGESSGPSASRAAAGIINPVTGRWMTKSWRFDRLFPIAVDTYSELSRELGVDLYHPVPARRFFQNKEDAKRAGRRSRNPRYKDILGTPLAPGEAPTPLIDPAGSIPILGAGWADLPALIDGVRSALAKGDDYHDERFEHAALHGRSSKWVYAGETFAAVIFCEGVGLRENPWFADLPLAPVKGETLELHGPDLALAPGIYHSRKWLLAYGNARFRLGATYDEGDLGHAPTSAGRDELLADARKFVPDDFEWEITRHLAGLRPATVDTHPMAGAHPTEKGLYLLNGLGSKGALSAPWLSRHLTEHLRHGAPLDPEVDLRRFTS